MLFNSYILIFIMLPVSIIGYFLINKTTKYRLGLTYVLAMSFLFIGYMNIYYLLILIPSLLFNYLIAYLINGPVKNQICVRKLLLALGVIADVGILFFYKYYDFFVSSINEEFRLDIPTLQLLLPLGISFYTFQQISYIVDCYRDSSIKYGIVEYALFISFYPQFVQGPIVLQDELIPQFIDESKKSINYENVAKGLYRFILGLSKKVIIADNLALVVDGGYGKISSLNSVSTIVLMLSYTLQIYFDFSGYSDMAIGIAKMFNIELPENFDSPYKSKSIGEFWDRWHITLTRFFTKYIYIPLGGSRRGTARTYANIFIIFLVSGLWHGAEWSFLIWGGLHGVAMIIERVFKKASVKLPAFVSACITFIFVNIAWVFFRAPYTEPAVNLLGRLFCGGFNEISKYMYEPFDGTVEGALLCRMDILGITNVYPGILVLVFVLAMCAICILNVNSKELTARFTPNRRSLFVGIVLSAWCLISFGCVTNFVYWNF